MNRAARRQLKKLRIQQTQTDMIYAPLTAAEAAISRGNNEPLPYAIQYNMITTLRGYVDALRAGTLNRTQYMRLTIMNYAAAIAANTIANLDDTGQVSRLGKKLEDTAQALCRIGERYNDTGKMVATGNDLRDVLHSVDFTADLLGLVPGYVIHDACKEANAGAQRSEHAANRARIK